MVYRRSPNSRWINKLSTFGMILTAGTLHRFKHIIDKYFNLNKLQSLSNEDSPFLPDNLKTLFADQKAKV